MKSQENEGGAFYLHATHMKLMIFKKTQLFLFSHTYALNSKYCEDDNGIVSYSFMFHHN